MDTSWSEAQAARWQVLVGEVRRRLGPGAALSPTARRFFQGQLGTEEGEGGDNGTDGVMVHRGPFAGYLTGGMQAAAATVDGHVLGEESGLSEDTAGGAALLGHELVHARVQRAPAAPEGRPEEDEDEDEERLAQQMEETVGEIVGEIENEQAVEDERSARRAPVNATALAEHVYQRLVTEVRRERERGAW